MKAPDAGELPVGAAKAARVRAMFDTIAPRYDLLNRLMTLGLDQRWRRRTLAALGLPAGARVLDLACGTGDLSRLGERRHLVMVGFDLSSGMLAANKAAAPIVHADGSALPVATGAFDGVVSGYAVRNFSDLASVAAEVARVLRPGGRLALLEVATPRSRLVAAGFSLWFERGVPLLGAALSDADAYRYLPRSLGYLPSPAEMRALLGAHGFATIGHRLLSRGLSQLYTATRTGRPSAR